MKPAPSGLLHLLAAEALRNLLAAGLRTVLALLGVVIGTASVIAMINVGWNAEVESLRRFKAMGTNLIVAHMYQDQQKGAASDLAPAALEAVPADAPSLSRVTPLLTAGLTLGRGEGLPVSIIGAPHTVAEAANLEVIEGRFFGPYDQGGTFAVVGADIAFSSKIPGGPLLPGARIRLKNYIFTVIGVLNWTAHNPLLPFDPNTGVFVPLESMRRLTDDQRISSVLALAAEGADPAAAADNLKARLTDMRRGRAPDHIESARQLLEGMRAQARIMTNLLAAIGGISLLVGGVGVMNVMLMSIAERRREIGLRMALGARRGHIHIMFLMEAALLSLGGGLIGTLFGLTAGFTYAEWAQWTFSPSPWALPIGAALSAGVGLFFGAYPAVTAARLDPIETLRAE